MHEGAWVCRGLISLLHGCSSRGGADYAEEGALLRECAVSTLRSETCPVAGFDVRANERGWRRRRVQEHLGTSCTRVVTALTVTAGWVCSVVTADRPGVSLARRRSDMSTMWILGGHSLDKMRGIPLVYCGLTAVVHEHLGTSCTPIGVVDLRLAIGSRTGSQSDRVAVRESTCVRSGPLSFVGADDGGGEQKHRVLVVVRVAIT